MTTTLETQIRSQAPSIFNNLERFSGPQVKFFNWYQRTFAGRSGWQKWIKEGFGELLASFSGTRLQIYQLNEVNPEQKQTYLFEKTEILIGRSDDNDIALTFAVVSRRHARIFARGTSYFVEDLGSSTGTYLNGRPLRLLEPQPLADGDELLIFPYRLQARLEELWVPDGVVAIAYTAAKSTTATHFGEDVPSGFCKFRVQIHPGCGDALLAVNRDFLEMIVSGMMHEAVSELVAADLGLFEFVLVHVLERANREVKLPLQFSLQPLISIDSCDPGFAVDLTVKTTNGVGAFQVFLSNDSLAEMQKLAGPGNPRSVDPDIRVGLPVRVGHVDLSRSDLAGLEPGDILLYLSAPEVVLPTPAKGDRGIERGWQAAESGKDPYRFEIQKFFERSLLMENDSDLETDNELVEKPDLSVLPVRVHVVLSQIELSFRELEALAEGSILELDHAKSDAVQLVANGKLLGMAQLVEVEDKLGVQITKWSAS